MLAVGEGLKLSGTTTHTHAHIKDKQWALAGLPTCIWGVHTKLPDWKIVGLTATLSQWYCPDTSSRRTHNPRNCDYNGAKRPIKSDWPMHGLADESVEFEQNSSSEYQ
eukprot:502651-Rhodomonas_salina.1